MCGSLAVLLPYSTKPMHSSIRLGTSHHITYHITPPHPTPHHPHSRCMIAVPSATDPSPKQVKRREKIIKLTEEHVANQQGSLVEMEWYVIVFGFVHCAPLVV